MPEAALRLSHSLCTQASASTPLPTLPRRRRRLNFYSISSQQRTKCACCAGNNGASGHESVNSRFNRGASDAHKAGPVGNDSREATPLTISTAGLQKHQQQPVSKLADASKSPTPITSQRGGPLHEPDKAAVDGLEAEYATGRLPTATEGLNWWCYTIIGLIFITDFTPLGPLLLKGSRDAALYLCAVQWGLFVLPTLNYCRERRWDLVAVLRLRPCAPSWLLAGLGLGPLLWGATAAAIAARTGADLTQLTGAASAAAFTSAGGGALPADTPLAGLLFGELLQRPGDAGQWLRVMATSALSPAVAEEVLYRGFLLTALRQRLGAVDAAAVAAAMFAAAHLSLPQFFAFTLLGGCCGGLTLASGSVLPAVAVHAAYNATGIVVGLAAALAGAGRLGP